MDLDTGGETLGRCLQEAAAAAVIAIIELELISGPNMIRAKRRCRRHACFGAQTPTESVDQTSGRHLRVS